MTVTLYRANVKQIVNQRTIVLRCRANLTNEVYLKSIGLIWNFGVLEHYLKQEVPSNYLNMNCSNYFVSVVVYKLGNLYFSGRDNNFSYQI